jgi:hypothetical protein
MYVCAGGVVAQLQVLKSAAENTVRERKMWKPWCMLSVLADTDGQKAANGLL